MWRSADPWAPVERGETRRGWWDPHVSEVARVPVLVARGLTDGPTLLVTAGVHGDEYEGPAAISEMIRRLDSARLTGTVIGVPVLNVAAWGARSRESPLDGVNLNRVFGSGSGNASSGPSTMLAEAVFEAFVRRSDALLDLHSGGVALDHLPLIGWYAGGHEAERIARRFGSGLHPWIMPDVPGVLSYEAHHAGKTALGAEWHGGGHLDPAGAEAYAAGIRRMLGLLGMYPNDAGEFDQRLPIVGDYQATPVAGLFRPCAELGDRVTQGDRLGVMQDLFGTVSHEIRAIRDGIVAGLAHLPWLEAGARVAYIG